MKSEQYAIAEIAGQQVILTPGKKVKVPRLDQKEGAKFAVKNILYLRNGEKVEIGSPYLKDFTIETKVVEHDRDKKVIVFKKKRRKGYKVKKGHRQQFTVLEITKVGAPKKAAKKATPKAKKAAPAPSPAKTKESTE